MKLRAAVLLAPFTVALLATPTAATTPGEDRVEIGLLNCAVEGGAGFVFGSTKQLECVFDPADENRPDETYFGTISKFGIDIGVTGPSVITWAVLAPTVDYHEPGALAGFYDGVTAEATAGVGVGANVLIGGSEETIALQPLSVSAQTGVNVAVAISQLELNTVVD